MEMKLQMNEPIRTVSYEQIMNEEFLRAYHDALKYSNLQLDQELKYRNIGIYEE